MSKRINFGQLKEVIQPPNLIENQIDSFTEFLQMDLAPTQRKQVGLEAVFSEVFPIESYDSRCHLEYVSYTATPPRETEIEAIREGVTYSVSLYVKLRLREEDHIKDEEIYMGELPMISERGSFIINGAERVIVSQLHRSPGIAFEESVHTSGKVLHAFRIIPDRGTWLEVQFDQNDLLYVYLDRRRRRRKFLLTTLLRAMGYGSDADILNLFYELEEITVADALKRDSVSNLVLTEDIVDADKGVVLARAFEPLTKTIVRSFEKAGLQKVVTIDTTVDDGAIIRCLKKDPTQNEEEALKDIYKRLRPGEPPTTANAKALLKRLFQDPRRYDLGRVGRYKLNQKLAMDTDLDFRVISAEDVVEATKYLTRLKRGDGMLDDIDHLGSRRVRTVGELLANQCRVGLARTERLVKERMTLYDQSVDSISPQKLINPKALSTVIRDFFARSQLSQFMDQINPLAELTHKRRLSALGPGGLNRERAGFEVRDVHPSHYGRICPIETPEGPNIGLINSLSLYSTINEFGFIETPYRKVVNGHVTDEVEYLNADQEEPHMIAQANSELDENSNLIGRVTCRNRDEVLEIAPKDVNYMDVSPKQLISVAAGIIPFLEHDDANRALMGSNMQRQGVPLLQAEAPFVGTGIESRVALDSKTVEVADIDGIIASVDANHIVLTHDGEIPKMKELKTDAKKGVYVYNFRKFMRSNAGTCFNQKPIVAKGQPVKKGDVLADGASTDKGELAIGRNILVAFMPWNGYNFEDAILISEKIVKDDIFTSIHVSEFEVTARDTKLGPEEITRDIPNVGEEALKDLNHDGVIRVGAEVKPGDILVGKITPKSETELAPEEKLLRAIFGEKAADVKDTSLVVPSGVRGIIMDVKVSARVDGEPEELSASDRRRQKKKINEEYRSQSDKLREDLTEALSNILLGEKIPLDVKNGDTDEIIIPANRKITKTLLRRLAAVSKHIEIDPSPVKIKIMEIVSNYQGKFDELDYDRERKVEGIDSGEDSDQGVVKSVKVYIAKKQKMQVGDKMAGRHGNKGVVAKVVPEEDMPHLPDGTPIEICLNPLGVPSRMNVGQVLETHLGWACKKLGITVATPVFDGISEARVREYLAEAGLPTTGKSILYDGQTGEPLAQEVVVGYMYMLKLNHLVASKIHARAVGPYSLITQQPLGGKAQYGGQRFGEMEVWALEAYGAAYTLQELLTVKSDDVAGRTRIYESLVKGDNSLQAGTPQSFNVLMKEIQSLCLDVRLSSEGKFASSTVLDAQA
ncbi:MULTISPECIES: DNA-directed RNA polymerase subunit beta [unclassified Lentimonas]|uniref:DNA-directed RNA polymerase subunit beta n=1 Tax=unclassified Lentimonas TaxID=2630993 RepID=UPI00132AC01E|nr:MULTISPECIES: DNA-directed RNA polymerase subunit beta [unclassified Lentimonas]CAA6677500.1 DNA-directed RNA polymerase beta subunit (EC [Lentimonas sp. CC4]CAA6686470.1 DNA-directed RNA polymerase beta subunit (EC [Lentimonas sp. CC6]CAA6690276.1 DNA-directed RNA polymerase beta subunit (EC [Lentimonas sp. CC19]CAA6690786.1 DNA-directed RNA polymerase beta subunit (EC [Lentimonas sp. CC10]CAA7068539.1 DNA-directed RNA polymerase beta subunit (EC [Lentimonas sp. CC11]